MSRSTYPNKITTSIPESTMKRLGMISIASGLSKDEIYSLSLTFAANHDDFLQVIDAYKEPDKLAQAETVDIQRMNHPFTKASDALKQPVTDYYRKMFDNPATIHEDPRD